MDESSLKACISALNKSKDALDLPLYIFSAMVIVGVVFEWLVIWHDHSENMEGWRRGIIRPPDKPSHRWLIADIIGVAIVFIGLAGETFVEIKSGNIDAKLRNANGELVRLLGKEAGDAKSSAKAAADLAVIAKGESETAVMNAKSADTIAKEAAITAGQAERKSVAASTLAEESRLKAEDAKKLAASIDRRANIIRDHANDLRKSLVRYKGQRFTALFCGQSDEEINEFMVQTFVLLDSVGWTEAKLDPSLPICRRGFTVEVNPKASIPARLAAAGIAAAFFDLGIKTILRRTSCRCRLRGSGPTI